ncbi:hypothetical protein [Bacillus sp. FJAT-27225]|nr:hypothetical protein [Bacillus sp. FJAT-27225]
MEKGNSNEKSKKYTMLTFLEEVKGKNLMDWGEIELAETVLHGRNS